MGNERKGGFCKLRGCTSICDDYYNFDTINLPRKHKRAKSNKKLVPKEEEETEEDRLSALPDSLLLHILSFLDTKEVVKTCLLSKRWQFIWTGISEIDLKKSSFKIYRTKSFVDYVGRMLAMCKGNHLNKFAVDFQYLNFYASIVDHWVHIAVESKVKDIILICETDYNDIIFCETEGKLYYKLPQMLFSYSSLTSLSVGYCIMAPRGAIEWGSLKSLSIEEVELSDCVMEKILSGCPVLEILHLTAFWGLNCLNISCPNLTTLVVEYWEKRGEPKSFFEISAPYVRDLTISGNVRRKPYRLVNISSLVRASLHFSGSKIDSWKNLPFNTMNYMIQILESLHTVKNLELGPWCVEILLMLELKGWNIPQSTRRSLTLSDLNLGKSFRSILGILEASPNLETLVIKGKYGTRVEKNVTPDLAAAYCLCYDSLDFALFHLKTIRINGFKGPTFANEPMLTLVRLLLKSAKVLEKMVISGGNESIRTSSTNSTSTHLTKFTSKLLDFPRASPEAIVVVR